MYYETCYVVFSMPDSDFYFLSDYSVDFIHGDQAEHGGSSAVIYKIVKMNNAPLSRGSWGFGDAVFQRRKVW